MATRNASFNFENLILLGTGEKASFSEAILLFESFSNKFVKLL